MCVCVDVICSVGQLTLCFPLFDRLAVTICALLWLVAVGAVVPDFSHSCLAVFDFFLGDDVVELAFLDRCEGLFSFLTISVFFSDVNGVFLLGVIIFEGSMGLFLCFPSFPHRCCMPCCDCSCGNCA